MIVSPIFKRTIFISFLGHLAVFGIFSFSFGDRLPKANFAQVRFFGSILRPADVINRAFKAQDIKKDIFIKESRLSALDKVKPQDPFAIDPYIKPSAQFSVNKEKLEFWPPGETLSFTPTRKEPVIMFYPRLPYNFLFYFKDREAVHIELIFNIMSVPKSNSVIMVKRRISSGNLEADLLSMRYISHYLFVEQARFPPNSWQTVKIDLSAKDDQP